MYVEVEPSGSQLAEKPCIEWVGQYAPTLHRVLPHSLIKKHINSTFTISLYCDTIVNINSFKYFTNRKRIRAQIEHILGEQFERKNKGS